VKKLINIQKEIKKDKRRNRLFHIFNFSKFIIQITAIFLIVFSTLFIANQRMDELARLDNYIYLIRSEIYEAIAFQNELIYMYEYMGSLEFIEIMARKRLGFARPDEIIFILNEE
jgi:cell division protein FtsB